MPNLNKIISLNQASKISGYHQDYLSSLLRKNEIKGTKMGNNWFTTEEEIRNYIFKQKIRNKNWFVKGFLYLKKMNKSFIYSLILLVLISMGIYFYNEKYNETHTQAPNITTPTSVSHFDTKQNLNF